MNAEPIEVAATDASPLMARTAGALFMSGSGLGLALLVLSGEGHGDRLGMAIVLGIAGAVGAAVLLSADRLPTWFFPLLGAGATLLLTTLIYLTHDGASSYSFFYIWVGVWSCYFFNRVAAFAQLALMAAAYGTVLAVGSPGVAPIEHWVLTVGTAGGAGWLVALLAVELRQRAENMGVLLSATSALAGVSEADSARPLIADALLRFAGGSIAALYEPDADGAALRLTANAGGSLPDTRLFFVGQQSVAARAFIDAQAIFIGELVDAPNVHRGLQKHTNMRAGLWQPVLRHGQAVAVLAVFWDRPIKRMPAGLAELAMLLASEAATTIERADLMRRLEAVARTDDLTGLPNRRAWEEELPKELGRSQRGRHPLCVAMLDLDRFKDYNDEHGHQAGDRVLKQAAGAWGERLRATDMLARYGGEEFALILPGCDTPEALRLVEQLRASTPADQTVSVGVALWDGEETPYELLSRADAALYTAKSAGRDRAVAAH